MQKEIRPFFSIIIPVYNAQEYLEKCILSILCQTFSDFELLLVDDGSTDQSIEICIKYALDDNRIKIFRKENGGSLQTRIYGVERASGKYILYCDADDFYPSKRCFQLLYEEARREQYDLISFEYYKKYGHIRLVSKIFGKKHIAYQDEFYMRDYPVFLCSFWKDSRIDLNVWSKLYRRELMYELPSSDNVNRVFMGDDLILNLYVLQRCKKVLFLSKPLYTHRMLSGGTKIYNENAMQDLNEIKKEQFFFLEKQNRRNAKKIEKISYSEVAGWFFSYIQESLPLLGEEETKNMINMTMQYPMFVRARHYFQEESQEDWQGAFLMRNANADDYIEAAKETKKRKSSKEKMKDMCRKILYFI